jgi:hypothetical protein
MPSRSSPKPEGSVKGPWVDELVKGSASKRQRWQVDSPMSIDGRSEPSTQGRDLILRMQREGVALKGASGFLRQVLEDTNTNSEQFQGNRS